MKNIFIVFLSLIFCSTKILCQSIDDKDFYMVLQKSSDSVKVMFTPKKATTSLSLKFETRSKSEKKDWVMRRATASDAFIIKMPASILAELESFWFPLGIGERKITWWQKALIKASLSG